jgi:hypothetical protein
LRNALMLTILAHVAQKSNENSLTRSATGPELAALALYLLGGGARLVDTEDVAIQIHKIAPGRYSWRKYPEQINLELVRVALSDARKSESGSLVTGTGRGGWSLTAAGQRWAEANAQSLVGQNLTKHRAERSAGSIDERRWQRERARLMTTEAWRQWSAVHDATAITAEAAADVFRLDRYVVGRAREMQINRLRDMFADDDDLAAFVEAAAVIVLGKERQ